MSLDVIIPFYGQFAALQQCLDSLSVTPEDEATLHLIDDASCPRLPRGLLDKIRTPGLRVRTLTLARRSGFVSAVNAAWKRSTGDVAVVLNSDTIVPPRLLPTLHRAMLLHRDLACIAPTSDNPLDLFQYRSGDAPRAWARASDKSSGIATLLSARYLTGSCIAIRREAVEGDWLFDPVYAPGYFEDLDLSCRLRASGWRLAIMENVRIHHAGRMTFGAYPELAALLARNCATFSRRWSHLQGHHSLMCTLDTVPSSGGFAP